MSGEAVCAEKLSENDKKLHFAVNASIKKVTEDFERFSFNTAISSIMEMVNELYRYKDAVSAENYNKEVIGEAIRVLIVILSPIAPHITGELWEIIGNEGELFEVAWPKYDPDALTVSEVEIVIQINGKIRDKMMIAADMSRDDMAELAKTDEKIKALYEGKQAVKVIAVPNKLINIVVK